MADLDLSGLDLDGVDDDEQVEVEETHASKLKAFGDLIIGGLFEDDLEVVKLRKANVFRELPPVAFKNEQYAIYKILFAFKDKNFQIDSEFIKVYLPFNQKLITDSPANIHLHEYSADTEYPVDAFIASTLDYFESVVLTNPSITDEEFNRTVEMFKMEFTLHEANTLLQNAQTILEEGLKAGRKTLLGFEDSRDYVRHGISTIEGVLDSSQGTGYVSLDDIDAQKESYSVELVTDFGEIHELNRHYGGIHTRTLTNIMAPNKGGKSKFCARLAYTAMTKFGHNVTYWPAENGVGIDSSQLRAIHFDRMANDGKGIAEAKLGVDWTVIEFDKWEKMGHADWREVEYAYFQELRSNPEYGTIDYIDRKLDLDTFIEDIDISVKRNNSKLVVIDYLPRISYPSKMSRHEAIEKAYGLALDYAKRNNVAILTPAQIKQDYIESLSKTSEGVELRAAAGESSEVLKSADLSLMLWATTQDLANNRMQILSMPSRIASPLAPVELYTDLGTCKFVSAN